MNQVGIISFVLFDYAELTHVLVRSRTSQTLVDPDQPCLAHRLNPQTHDFEINHPVFMYGFVGLLKAFFNFF